MKDQKLLYLKSFKKNIPVFVLHGLDVCAYHTVAAYEEIAISMGCDTLFLQDLKCLVNDFKLCSQEESDCLRLLKSEEIALVHKQKELLFDGLRNSYSIFVLTAKDICAIPTLKKYRTLLSLNRADGMATFLVDNYIKYFKYYQDNNPELVHVPKLNDYDKVHLYR